MVTCTRFQERSDRETVRFNNDWKFLISDDDHSATDMDDDDWRALDIPHDWSIEGEFSPEHPATTGGGALPGGTGWYRKHFTVPARDSGRNFFIHFDGIYWNSTVYLNGKLIGERPNGYVSFRYDMTPLLHFGERENILAVKVDNSEQPNSRWYSGSGIYRNVYLIKVPKVHIDSWGTFVTTPVFHNETATVNVAASIRNTHVDPVEADIFYKIISPSGKVVSRARKVAVIPASSTADLEASFEITKPRLWSVDKPELYRIQIAVRRPGGEKDLKETKFGIRTFRFDSEKGFFLNGKPLKILGVCNHHDLGCLGAAVNRRAIERQLELLKGMGVNAIRTAHNPPAPELLDLCDRMGFLVMDETFDMWAKRKSPFDYSRFWDEWHERDLRDHILRDRNHPSVFLWSIGNEILEQWDSSGIEMTRELYDIVRELDTTRQIVTGNNFPYPGNMLLEAGVMDVIGYNYKHEDFRKFPETFPGKFFIATETTSGLMTRGYYDMPSDSIRRWPYRWDRPFRDGNPDHTVSSYDNVSTPWGSTHEESWSAIKKHDFLSGMFIWTGFDYLGEPTPYGWPSRSSYFGIFDLAGFPKDVYYMYKSEWTDEPVLHIFPHWNWVDGQEIDVWAYTNCESVELFLNGRSMGVKQNNDTTLHLQWRLNYEPGEVLAVGVLPDGDTLVTRVRTAGEPVKLEVLADRDQILADGRDLVFLTVNVLDENGILVPHADNMVQFRVEGDAHIAATDNGNQVGHESFRSPSRKAFNGKCLAVVQAGNKPGEIRISAYSEGLQGREVTVKMR